MMLKWLLLIIPLLSITKLAGQDSVRDSLNATNDTEALTDSVLAYAHRFVGCGYGYGSCGPKTFDCSGFVQHVYGKFGVNLPHGSATQSSVCDEIKLKKVQPGDLLFFAGRKISGKRIGHVAIVESISEGHIRMIHATVQSGVIVEELETSAYFQKRFISAGRIRQLKN